MKYYLDHKNLFDYLTLNICRMYTEQMLISTPTCYLLKPHTDTVHQCVNPCTVLPTQFFCVKCYGAKSVITIGMEKLRGDPFIPPDYPNGTYESLFSSPSQHYALFQSHF